MDRRKFIKTAAAAGVVASQLTSDFLSRLYADENVDKHVRIGFIGVGGRGTGLLRIMLGKENLSIPAICDIDESHLNRAIGMVKKAKGNDAAGYCKGEKDYLRMLERDDLDGVLIATPAWTHAQMAEDCMLAGKDVASEVPGAYTIDECWRLVKTKEKTGQRYMLLENYFYGNRNMAIYNMIKQGVFGDPYFAECSYIHNCANLRFVGDGKLTWRGDMKHDLFGNLYPTHALGPVAKWLDINRGNQMTHLTSYMSKPAALHRYAERRFGAESKSAKMKFKAGDMCKTLIQTSRGQLIDLQYDTDSPRPFGCHYLVQGGDGIVDSRFGFHVVGREGSKGEKWESISVAIKEYQHELWRQQGEAARKTGHGGGDFFVISEFVNSVRAKREPFIDVYDSAAWSSIMELSQKSIKGGNKAMKVPDFTRGGWKNRNPIYY